MPIFLPKMKWRPKKDHHLRWRPVLGHENIGGGGAAGLFGGYIPPWICTHGYERFEIIEKLYLSKALLKMAGGGTHPPHPPLDPPLVLGMRLNVCLLVLRQLFFEKFAGAPHGQKRKYGMGAFIARVKTKNILTIRIGLFNAPLSYVD